MMLRKSVVLLLLVVVFFGWSSGAVATPLTPGHVVANWTNENSPADVIGGSTVPATTNWQVQTIDGADVIYTGGNLSGSLISDFVISGDFVFSGQFSAVADGDRDLIGFVFGWQDYDDTHFVAWGGHPVDRWNGNYHISDRTGATYTDLLKTHSHWTAETWYDFSVEKTGATYRVLTSDGGTTVSDYSFSDSTLDGRRVGIQVHSQATYFKNLTFIPEPSTGLLVSLGLIGLSFVNRRRRVAR